MNCMKGNTKIGRIVLSLDSNFILSTEKLQHTPSQRDGIDHNTEIELRILACEMIQSAGILLKLPQVAMGTGQVLFQRFYFAVSFVNHPMEVTAMACIYLASKIEEAPRRIRDIMNVFHHLKQMKQQKLLSPLILDTCYILQKKNVISVERRILKELGFAVHVKHPHKLIVVYLQILAVADTKCIQMAWNYMNDSLRTDVFVRYQPETIACACIFLSARMLKVRLPRSPPWFAIFKVTEDDIKDVCFRILELYNRPKPNAEELMRRVTELERRKEYEATSFKLKEAELNKPVPLNDSESKVDMNGFRRKPSEPNARSDSKTDRIRSNSSDQKSGSRYNRDSKRYKDSKRDRYHKDDRNNIESPKYSRRTGTEKRTKSNENNYRQYQDDDKKTRYKNVKSDGDVYEGTEPNENYRSPYRKHRKSSHRKKEKR